MTKALSIADFLQINGGRHSGMFSPFSAFMACKLSLSLEIKCDLKNKSLIETFENYFSGWGIHYYSWQHGLTLIPKSVKDQNLRENPKFHFLKY